MDSVCLLYHIVRIIKEIAHAGQTQQQPKNRQNQPRANSSDVLHLAGRTTPSRTACRRCRMQPAVSHIPAAPRTHANACTHVHKLRPTAVDLLCCGGGGDGDSRSRTLHKMCTYCQPDAAEARREASKKHIAARRQSSIRCAWRLAAAGCCCCLRIHKRETLAYNPVYGCPLHTTCTHNIHMSACVLRRTVCARTNTCTHTRTQALPYAHNSRSRRCCHQRRRSH